MASLLWLVRLAERRMGADEPEPEPEIGCRLTSVFSLLVILSNSLRGVNMNVNRVLLTLTIIVLSGSQIFPSPTLAQFVPPAKKAARVRITQCPAPELDKEDWTIIRVTTKNPVGSLDHV